MALISDLKAATDAQFTAAMRLMDVAQDLLTVQRDLEHRGETDAARKVQAAIERLASEGENLITNARSSGRSAVNAIKSAW